MRPLLLAFLLLTLSARAGIADDASARKTSASVATVPAIEPCWSGCDCVPYYRDRPRGGHRKRKRIIHRNHRGEPAWYRYYRCEHFGHYPPQWRPWPAGWDRCRRPVQSHPYDILPEIPEPPDESNEDLYDEFEPGEGPDLERLPPID